MEANVRVMRHIIIAFEKKYGRKELIKFIERTGLPLEYFDDENNWISHKYLRDLLKALVDYSGDPNIPYKFGLTTATNLSWGVIKTILKSFSSCSYAYKKVVSLSPRWGKVASLKYLKFKKNNAILKISMLYNNKQDKYNCLNIQGQLASIPTIWGLPPAEIKELQCAAKGADSCIYEIKWKNVPKKKKGLYAFFVGAAISGFLYLLSLTGIFELSQLSGLNFFLLPVIIFLLWIASLKKEIIKEGYKKTEEQNDEIEKILIEIEKSNTYLQEKVEEKVASLTENIEDLKKKIAFQQSNEDQSIRTAKMNSIGQLAVYMANVLRKPLDKIHTNVQSLLKDFSNNEDVTDSLEGAERAAQRCEKIIAHLLSFSENGSSPPVQEVDLNIIINECIAKANEEFGNSGIKISSQAENGLPKVKADYSVIEQVLMIIITNAADAILDAMNKGDKDEGKILIKTGLKNTGMALVEISDNGCGMPKDVMAKIFDPFFSTKTSSRKKGMGLTLSYNAVKKAGGSIEVKSAPGAGTTFSIYLPVMEAIKTN
ncbi:MAG: ATP-binding protein [Spirochaetota bacterium]